MNHLLCACGAQIRPRCRLDRCTDPACPDDGPCRFSHQWVDARGDSGFFYDTGRHEHEPGPGSQARCIQGLLEALRTLQ